MANNRLYLRNKKTGKSVMIAKRFGGDWQVWHQLDIDRLDRFLKTDGADGKDTDLEVVTENSGVECTRFEGETNTRLGGRIDFEIDAVLHEHYIDKTEGLLNCDKLEPWANADTKCSCGADEANSKIRRLWEVIEGESD